MKKKLWVFRYSGVQMLGRCFPSAPENGICSGTLCAPIIGREKVQARFLTNQHVHAIIITARRTDSGARFSRSPLAQWQSVRLLTEMLVVRVHRGEFLIVIDIWFQILTISNDFFSEVEDCSTSFCLSSLLLQPPTLCACYVRTLFLSRFFAKELGSRLE